MRIKNIAASACLALCTSLFLAPDAHASSISITTTGASSGWHISVTTGGSTTPISYNYSGSTPGTVVIQTPSSPASAPPPPVSIATTITSQATSSSSSSSSSIVSNSGNSNNTIIVKLGKPCPPIVPLPAALPLFGSALIGIALKRRMAKKNAA